MIKGYLLKDKHGNYHGPACGLLYRDEGSTRQFRAFNKTLECELVPVEIVETTDKDKDGNEE